MSRHEVFEFPVAWKDTFVTTALRAGVKQALLEAQTGVAWNTLKRHYGRWVSPDHESELERFTNAPGALFGAPIATPTAARGGKSL